MRIYFVVIFVVPGLILILLDVGISEARVTGSCYCPQKSDGWRLFADHNRSVPDFWWQDSVAVQEILVCGHGVHFLFTAEQDGRPHYVALVVVKPTRELFETRGIPDIGDPSMENQLTRATRHYAKLMTLLDCWWGEPLSKSSRLDFTDSHEKPIVVPRQGLIMKWDGRETALRGYLDVYMTMLV
jgi:hypothetical protein